MKIGQAKALWKVPELWKNQKAVFPQLLGPSVHTSHNAGCYWDLPQTQLYFYSLEWRGERRSTVAARRRAFGWRGSRSGGCGRSPWGAGEVGSDGETHRVKPSLFADCDQRSRAREDDLLVGQRNQAMVGHGESRAAEILQDVLGCGSPKIRSLERRTIGSLKRTGY